MRNGLIALLPVVAALLACRYDNESDTGAAAGGAGGGSGVNVAKASIDTGAALTTDPGQGVGLLVEYEAGGKWHIHMACDTALSSERCHWDVLVEPLDGTRIRNVSADQLDTEDELDSDSTGARLLAATGTDVDGMFIEGDPGAGLRVDVLIDGELGNQFVYWIGGGAMHRGAPTNPVDLTPTEP